MTSVYESSATQPVRQVSSIPEVSIGKGGDPDQQEDPRSCVHVPRYIIICRVSSRQQVHGHSLENQLFAMEAGHRAKYTMYVEAYTMVSRRL